MPADSSVLYRFTVLTIMACAIGALVSLAALAFVECVQWLNDALLVSHRARIQVNQPLLLGVVTVLVPTLGGLLVGLLLYRFTSSQRAYGPADVIKAVQLRTPLSCRSGPISTVAAGLSLGCGASVGQYGPLVYLGALASALVDRFRLRIPDASSVAIACGVAAAISTAFNAPIAGLVFAHEVILRHYSLQAFAPTTVASATGFVVANLIFERQPLFLVAFDGVRHGYEFALFAVLGIVCAVLAMIFMKMILAAGRLAPRTRLPAYARPALAGMFVGLVALQLPDVLGIGAEALRFATIEGAFEIQELVLLIIAKLALTALCIGFGFAGGVFSPSLLIGILVGALFGSLLMLTGLPISGIAVYAISGMMALTSPVIGAPLTTILIVFELTRNYELTIAAMVSVVFANLLAFRLAGRSLFDVQLARGGVDLSGGRDRAQLQFARVVDQRSGKPLTLPPTISLDDALDVLSAEQRSEACVVDDAHIFVGLFRLQDAIGQQRHGQTSDALDADVSDVMYRDCLTLDETTTLWEAMNLMRKFVGEAVPILDSTTGRLLGSITEGELIAAWLAIAHEVRREENEAL